MTQSRFEPNQNSSGGNIFYSREKGRLDGVNFKGTYTLGHERYHGYQRDLGVKGYEALTNETGKDGIVPLGETQVVGIENYLRASFNESNYNSVRQTYTSKFLNINTAVRLEEYSYQRVWPQYDLGWTTPWDITDFVNKKYVWKNIRNEAIKEYTSN